MEQAENAMLNVWHPVTHSQRHYLMCKSILDMLLMWFWLAIVGAFAFGGYLVFAENVHEKLTPESFKSGLYSLYGFFVLLSILEIPVFWFLEIPRMQWRLTESQLSVQAGGLFRTESVMPLCRAQTYHTSQGVLAKNFDVTGFTVQASGGNQVHLSYLTPFQVSMMTQALDAAIRRDVEQEQLSSGNEKIEKL